MGLFSQDRAIRGKSQHVDEINLFGMKPCNLVLIKSSVSRDRGKVRTRTPRSKRRFQKTPIPSPGNRIVLKPTGSSFRDDTPVRTKTINVGNRNRQPSGLAKNVSPIIAFSMNNARYRPIRFGRYRTTSGKTVRKVVTTKRSTKKGKAETAIFPMSSWISPLMTNRLNPTGGVICAS